jgi:hypothetical protein
VKKPLLFALTLMLALTACQPNLAAPRPQATHTADSAPPPAALPTQPPAPSPTALPTRAEQPKPTPTVPLESPLALPKPPEPRPKYALEAWLDYAQHRLRVVERVDYPNTAGARLTALTLVVEPLRNPGVFQLGRIFDAEGQRVTNYRFEDLKLALPLTAPLDPGEWAVFTLEYALQLPSLGGLPHSRPQPLSYNELQANFGDWYPYIPPYSPAEGWLAHPAAAVGEHLVYDPADFEVTLHLEGAQTALVIAASAQPDETGDGWQQFEQRAARSFAWSASPYYQTLTQTVQLAEGREAVALSYSFPYHRQAGESLLRTLVEALTLYSELFGVYPRAALTAVQADFLDGMEYDGLFFLSTDFYNWHKDTPEDFLTALGAHETSHMWWLGLVGSDQAREPWLDEALATYSERLYYERYYPAALDWWWTWRVNYYEPSGPIDIQIYDLLAAPQQWRLYRDPVYLGGALFLEELRQWMGDEGFFAALKEYARRYAYRQADGAGFLEIMRQHSSQDPAPVIEKYFKYLR